MGSGARLAQCIAFALGLAVGCVRPQQPIVTPIALTALGAQVGGVQFQLDLSVYNPNRIGFTVRTLTARVRAGGRDLGPVAQAPNVSLPARRGTAVRTQLVVPWGDLPSLMVTGLLQPQVPFHMDGHVTVGGPGGISFTVPFQMDGAMPREMLLQTPFNTLQQMLLGR